jgi:hydroxymethylpyrimidine/phosphomethylpyrimidine kinase
MATTLYNLWWPFDLTQIMSNEPLKLLTIAGSDSGGAAGLQADLKTWTALGVYGMSVVTAVTAQNSVKVAGIQYLSGKFVTAQLEAVLSDYGAQAIKTGFLGQVEIIAAASRGLQRFKPSHLVVDPVLVNHLGQPMFAEEVVHSYRRQLLPLANLITPNRHEVALLAGLPEGALHTVAGLQKAAAKLHRLGAAHVLITGNREDDQMVDYWSDGAKFHRLPVPLIETENRHGSGDTLSAAICAFLARGNVVGEAIIQAQQFTARALKAAAAWRLGHGHGPLSHLTQT